jgi:formate dehydrogenase major subunit
VARVSNTPGFKAMFVRFEPHAGEITTATTGASTTIAVVSAG